MFEESYCPKIIDDLEIIEHKSLFNETFFVLGSKENDRYLKINKDNIEYIRETIVLFNGNHSIKEIKSMLAVKTNKNINVEQLCRLLSSTGLLQGSKNSTFNNEIELIGIELFAYQFKNTNPATVSLSKLIVKICIPISLITIIIGMIYIANNMGMNTFINGTFVYKKSAIKGLLVSIPIGLISLILHEVGHTTMALYLDRSISKFAISLYAGFVPIVYFKFRGVNSLQPVKKLMIILAGLYVNLFLVVVSLTLLATNHFSTNTSDILTIFAVSNYMLIVANIVPFSLSDGYYAFCTLINRYNIRMALIKQLFFHEKINKHHKRWYGAYLIFAVVFLLIALKSLLRWMVLFSQEVGFYSSIIVIALFTGFITLNIMKIYFRVKRVNQIKKFS